MLFRSVKHSIVVKEGVSYNANQVFLGSALHKVAYLGKIHLVACLEIMIKVVAFLKLVAVNGA